MSRWTEITHHADGLGVAMYDTDENDEVYVVDEAWFTVSELAAGEANGVTLGEE